MGDREGTVAIYDILNFDHCRQNEIDEIILKAKWRQYTNQILQELGMDSCLSVKSKVIMKQRCRMKK